MSADPSSQRFGNYRLLKKLGRGGMGEAWRAKREGPAGIEKDVVIKRILKDFSDDPGFRASFVNEAKLTARLSHGNIAQVFDFGEIDGEWFMAMEYVNGRPLARAVDRAREKRLRALPTPVAVYIAIEMLKGLAHAHTRTDDGARPLNIVHRDISPDNVMVSFEGEVKLLDFGIAKARLAGRQETQTGLVKGKVRYFSPEQAQGHEVDARSDIWSVALVLYEMLYGQPALDGQQHVVAMKVARGEVPPIRVRAPWVPQPLAEVMAKALEPDLDKRYPTALAFQEGLGKYLHQTAPELSQSSVAGVMGWLFDDELVFEGKSAEVTPAVQKLIDASSGEYTPTEEDISISKRGTVILSRPDVTETKKTILNRRVSPLLWATIGAAAVIAALSLGVSGSVHMAELKPKPPSSTVEEIPLPPSAPELAPEVAPTPEPQAPPSPDKAALLDAAMQKYNDRQFTLAVEQFEKAIEVGGREWMPVTMLGLSQVKLEKFAEGRALLLEGWELAGGMQTAPELRADVAFALALSAEATGVGKQEVLDRLRQCLGATRSVDDRVAQIRAEPRLKQYADVVSGTPSTGQKRSR